MGQIQRLSSVWRESLESAVKYRLVSDVDVGAFEWWVGLKLNCSNHLQTRALERLSKHSQLGLITVLRSFNIPLKLPTISRQITLSSN